MENPFIPEVIETNNKLTKLNEEEESKQGKNEPFVLHDIETRDKQFI